MSKQRITNYIVVIGETTDGKQLIDGVWKTFETHGLPLDIIFDVCIRRGWVPDWIELYKQMRQSNMEHGRILSKLEEAINDSFGKEFCGVVIFRLDKIFKPDVPPVPEIPVVVDDEEPKAPEPPPQQENQ